MHECWTDKSRSLPAKSFSSTTWMLTSECRLNYPIYNQVNEFCNRKESDVIYQGTERDRRISIYVHMFNILTKASITANECRKSVCVKGWLTLRSQFEASFTIFGCVCCVFGSFQITGNLKPKIEIICMRILLTNFRLSRFSCVVPRRKSS